MNQKIIFLGFGIAAALGGTYIGTQFLFKSGHDNFIQHKRTVDFSLLKQKDTVLPVAIIGDGPAGASAALYTSRSDLYTVVFQGPKPGGLLTETSYVENWPAVGKELGSRIINNLRSQAQEHGAVFVPETIKSVDLRSWPYKLSNEDGQDIYALSVIIATGAVPRVLGAPGEKEYWGKGVTTCAICDAPFYKGRDVVVVGGGDSAVEEAAQLAPHVRSVTMLVRKDSMRASKASQQHLTSLPNVKVQYNTAIDEIIGDGKVVNKIRLLDTATKKTSEMPIDGVFLAIGHEPRTALFKDQLNIDENGYIQLKGRSQETSVEGIFAAGDVEDHVYRQAGVASGSGIKAALDAYSFLQSRGYTKQIQQQLQPKLYEPQAQKGTVIAINSLEDFKKEVANSPIPVVLDFWARWCPSCLRMLPVVELVAGRFEGKIKFVKVDFAQVPALAEQLQVAKVPALVVYKQGEVVARYFDVMNKSEMTEFLQQFIA